MLPRITPHDFRESLQTLLDQAHASGVRVSASLQHEVRRLNRSRRDEQPGIRHLPTEPKPRKRPAPWSTEEENFLCNLISEHGAKWAKFEGDYGRSELYGRNQTALKDKARNIMRQVVNNGWQEDLYARFPKWREVTVGSGRRGVHAYLDDVIPERPSKKSLPRALLEDEESD